MIGQKGSLQFIGSLGHYFTYFTPTALRAPIDLLNVETNFVSGKFLLSGNLKIENYTLPKFDSFFELDVSFFPDILTASVDICFMSFKVNLFTKHIRMKI